MTPAEAKERAERWKTVNATLHEHMDKARASGSYESLLSTLLCITRSLGSKDQQSTDYVLDALHYAMVRGYK